MAGLTPCAVVVDTRNVHGQGRDLFGGQRSPSAASVRDALALYGFDALDIYAGVATRAVKKPPSQVVQQVLQHNNDYANRLRADGVTVLEGLIAERSKMEEKQVDVLLALQVAELVDQMTQLGTPFRHIIVLSEDMDLIPAYEYAARRGIEVYAAAADTIYLRPQQVKWLLLHESAMAALVGFPQYAAIGDSRSYAAAVAARSQPLNAVNWKSFKSQNIGPVHLYNGRGVEGVWASPTRIARGDRFQLFPDGVTMHGRFPHLSLTQAAPSAVPLPDFAPATVTSWTKATRMKVQMAFGATSTVEVSPGAALVGDQVLTYRDPHTRQASTHFVGSLTKWTAPAGWTAPDRTIEATVQGAGPSRRWLAASTASGNKVLVHADRLTHAKAGSRLLIAVTGVSAQYGLPTTVPLTCCLP